MPGSASQYFAPTPGTPSRPGTVRLDLPDLSLTLRTDRGVFSAERIDPGTKVLLADAPAPPAAGDLLDLGCGYGPIALTLAARSPGATVWAVDVNDRALDLTRANAAAAGLGNVVVARPDDVPAEVRFAALWSNPPVRVGKLALRGLLSRWLGRLAEGGRARLVVHKHLGADSLQRWLAGEGWTVERVRSRLGYRVLTVEAGAAASGAADAADADEAGGADAGRRGGADAGRRGGADAEEPAAAVPEGPGGGPSATRDAGPV